MYKRYKILISSKSRPALLQIGQYLWTCRSVDAFSCVIGRDSMFELQTLQDMSTCVAVYQH